MTRKREQDVGVVFAPRQPGQCGALQEAQGQLHVQRGAHSAGRSAQKPAHRCG